PISRQRDILPIYPGIIFTLFQCLVKSLNEGFVFTGIRDENVSHGGGKSDSMIYPSNYPAELPDFLVLRV
ncbi:MAG: hypothetical protein AAFQ57_16625, partial [Cyanobacteria bacterium J06626_14]